MLTLTLVRLVVGLVGFDPIGPMSGREAASSSSRGRGGDESSEFELCNEIELKSLILAQIERWRHALHMQVERQRGGNPGGERRTGE